MGTRGFQGEGVEGVLKPLGWVGFSNQTRFSNA